MDDIANLGFKVDTAGLKRAADQLDKLDTAGKKVKSTFKASGSAVEQALGGIDNNSSAAAQALGQVEQKSSAVGRALTGMKGLLAGLGLAKLATDAFQTYKSFEGMNASLKTVTGSVEAGKDAFRELKEFAADTPFALDQSVQGFIRLKTLGLDPSQEAMRSYGNTASAMNKSMLQVVEAVADASTFQFERLRELGITTSVQGDKIAFTFNKVTTVIKKDAASIEQYLQNIGNVEFAGAMDDQMNTLVGTTSEMGDVFDELQVKFIDASGAGDLVKAAMSGISEAMKGAIQWIDDISTSWADFKDDLHFSDDKAFVVLREIGEAIRNIGEYLKPVIPYLDELGIAIGSVIAGKAGIALTAGAFSLIGTAILGIGRALTANPIGLAITGLVLGAQLIYDNWDKLPQWWAGIWSGVQEKVESFLTWWDGFSFSEKLLEVKTEALEAAKTSSEAFTTWWNTSVLAEWIMPIDTDPFTAAKTLISDFVNWWEGTTLVEKVIDIGTVYIESAKETSLAFVTWWNQSKLKELVATVETKAMDTASGYAKDLVQWWDGVDIKEWILEVKSDALDLAKSNAEGFVKWWNQSVLKEMVPEIVSDTIEAARDKIKGFFDWWNATDLKQKTSDVVYSSIVTAWEQAKKFSAWWNKLSLKSLIPEIKMPTIDGAKSWFGNIVDIAKEAGGDVVAGFSDGIDRANDHIAAAENMSQETIQAAKTKLDVESMKAFGSDMIDGLIEGIKSKANAGVDAIKELSTKMLDAFGLAWLIESPSRIMIGMGEYIAAGLAVGIDNGSAKVIASIDNLSEKAKATFKKMEAALDQEYKMLTLTGDELERYKMGLEGVEGAAADVLIGKKRINEELKKEALVQKRVNEEIQKTKDAQYLHNIEMTEGADAAHRASLELNGYTTEQAANEVATLSNMKIQRDFKDALIDSMVQADSIKDAFKNLGDWMLDWLKRKVAEFAATKIMMFIGADISAAMAAFSSLLGGLTGLGGANAAEGSLDAAAASTSAIQGGGTLAGASAGSIFAAGAAANAAAYNAAFSSAKYLGGNGQGAGIGAVFGGPIGAAIGGAFGSGKRTTGSGIEVGYGGGDVYGQNYEDRARGRKWYGGTDRWTNYSELDAAVERELTRFFKNLTNAVTDKFTLFGAEGIDEFLDTAFNIDKTKIGSAEEYAEFIEDSTREAYKLAFTKLGPEMQEIISDSIDFDNMEIEDIEGITAEFAQAIAMLKPALEATGLAAGQTADQIAATSIKLAEAFGSADAAMEAMAFYINNFFTEAERNAMAITAAEKSVAEWNASIGLTGDAMITTGPALRAYIDGLDKSADNYEELLAAALGAAYGIATLDAALAQVQAGAGLLSDLAKLMGVNFKAASPAALKFSETLIELVGGFENFANEMQALIANVFSPEEIKQLDWAAHSQEIVDFNTSLGLFGDDMITTNDEFKEWVRGLIEQFGSFENIPPEILAMVLGVNGSFAAMGAAGLTLAEILEMLPEHLQPLTFHIRELGETAEEAAAKFKSAIDQFNDTIDEGLDHFAGSVEEFGEQFKIINPLGTAFDKPEPPKIDTSTGVADSTESLKTASEVAVVAIDAVSDTIKSVGEQSVIATDKMDGLKGVHETYNKSLETQSQAYATLTLAMTANTGALEAQAVVLSAINAELSLLNGYLAVTALQTAILNEQYILIVASGESMTATIVLINEQFMLFSIQGELTNQVIVAVNEQIALFNGYLSVTALQSAILNEQYVLLNETTLVVLQTIAEMNIQLPIFNEHLALQLISYTTLNESMLIFEEATNRQIANYTLLNEALLINEEINLRKLEQHTILNELMLVQEELTLRRIEQITVLTELDLVRAELLLKEIEGRTLLNELLIVSNELQLVTNELQLVTNELQVVTNELQLVSNELKVLENEHLLVNNELMIISNELALVANEQLLVANEQITLIKDNLILLNEQLPVTNEILALTIETLPVLNEGLAIFVEGLTLANTQITEGSVLMTESLTILGETITLSTTQIIEANTLTAESYTLLVAANDAMLESQILYGQTMTDTTAIVAASTVTMGESMTALGATITEAAGVVDAGTVAANDSMNLMAVTMTTGAGEIAAASSVAQGAMSEFAGAMQAVAAAASSAAGIAAAGARSASVSASIAAFSAQSAGDSAIRASSGANAVADAAGRAAANARSIESSFQSASNSASLITAINGSHAGGLARVPYDGYIAEVHKDEMIPPANVSNWLRSAGIPVRSEKSSSNKDSEALRNEIAGLRADLAASNRRAEENDKRLNQVLSAVAAGTSQQTQATNKGVKATERFMRKVTAAA